MLNELNLSAGFHFGLPSIDFWQNGIVRLIRPSGAGQIFHIGLNARSVSQEYVGPISHEFIPLSMEAISSGSQDHWLEGPFEYVISRSAIQEGFGLR